MQFAVLREPKEPLNIEKTAATAGPGQRSSYITGNSAPRRQDRARNERIVGWESCHFAIKWQERVFRTSQISPPRLSASESRAASVSWTSISTAQSPHAVTRTP